MAEQIHVGIDIGGTKTAVIAQREGSTPSTVHRIESRVGEGGASLVERAVDATMAALDDVGVGSPPTSVGVGAPGPLDIDAGVLLGPPNFEGWGERFDLRAALARHWPEATLTFDNDCNAGGLGELVHGAARGARDACYFGVGTGIGGCVIVDGRVIHGASGNAGELGQIQVAGVDDPSGTGDEGVVESEASGTVLRRRLAAAGIDIADLDAALARREPAAAAVCELAVEALGRAIAVVLNVLSPEVVVIGGGVAARQPWIVPAADSVARRVAFGPNATSTRIVPAELGGDSAVWGALALAGSPPRYHPA